MPARHFLAFSHLYLVIQLRSEVFKVYDENYLFEKACRLWPATCDFDDQLVEIRFVGTHAAYNRVDAKNIYSKRHQIMKTQNQWFLLENEDDYSLASARY